MRKICMVTYSNYERDPRVRRNSEALVGANFEVDVIALKDAGQSFVETVSGVRVYHVPFSKIRGGKISYIIAYSVFFLLSFFYVSFLHIRKKYDLLLIHNMPDFLVFSAILPKITRTPILLDIRDPMPELFGSIFRGRASIFFQSLLLLEERVSFNFSDKLLTVHKEMYGLLTHRGVDPHRLEIVRNLPDTTIFHKGIQTSGKHECFKLVYAGTISPRHHLDLVLEAILYLQSELPDIRFILVGDGPDIPRLKELAINFQIEDKVSFRGAIPVNEVPEILASCDVAVASYADDENGNLVFPTKVFEALEIGLPVLCTRVKTVQDYLGDDALFYFSPEDLESLIDQVRLIRQNPDLVKKKILNGQKFLLDNNWENEKNKLIQIIVSMSDGTLKSRMT